MNETRVDNGVAEVSGLALGGRRLVFLDRARIYTCGITPYDVTHLGHAATFVWVDALARTLRLFGVEPETCRNVTDVDDVLDEAAHRAGEPYDAFAAAGQYYFDRDMAALNVRDVQHEPRARRYVDQVIRLAGGLLAGGAAYVRDGSVYFRGEPAIRGSGLGRDAALRLSVEYGGRPDDPAKDDPLDVAVWQAGEPGHPAWDSPWGRGRPGWHAECAAMALSVFGAAVDVHAGGADLRFPHHAYQAAMVEAFTGVRPYARAWLHAGTVRVGGAKMAKSAGNLVLVRDLVDGHPAAAVRLMILDRPWGKDWDYSPALLDQAGARLEELYRAAGRTRPAAAAVAETSRLLAADLNVSAAVDVAIEEGGAAARSVIAVLGLN
ncbi:cysteine--tRNA ligase [Trebonia kvetii]|uniref:Cysteine--tRNA ligase n=1 Tax=Trebonia kvetii TaxID=2480626 RepID=A0A6P2C5D8_9ACTN|nr:cysteine--tRNA ligase [Trebonia kvetii]